MTCEFCNKEATRTMNIAVNGVQIFTEVDMCDDCVLEKRLMGSCVSEVKCS